ncbi:MAG: biotin transporter BioY [Clostridiales bacterium]|jgi:biotin transport system substrate-specific component|nr:biotin transporter BioY [Clostridiales bacterium]
MAMAGVFAAVMAVLSQLSIPLPITPVPLTMSLFAVCLIATVLAPRLAVLSQAVYLLLGAAGLPVFAGFKGGVAALLGPTGGFLMAYVPMTLAIGMIAPPLGRRLASRKPGAQAGAAGDSPPAGTGSFAGASTGATGPVAAQSVAYALSYLLATAMCYAFGAAWLMGVGRMDFPRALAASVLPFIPLDLIKIAACAAVAPAVRRALRRLPAAS